MSAYILNTANAAAMPEEQDDMKQLLLTLDPALNPVIVMGDGASPAR